MLTSIKNQFFNNWHAMRWVALILGLTLGANWIMNSAPISGFLALFFLFQAITNTGCLAGQCMPVQDKKNVDELNTNVEFIEIKLPEHGSNSK